MSKRQTCLDENTENATWEMQSVWLGTTLKGMESEHKTDMTNLTVCQ